MNIHMMQSRPNLLHLIAFLLVGTAEVVTAVAVVSASFCPPNSNRTDPLSREQFG